MRTVLITKKLTQSQASLLFNADIAWVNYSAIEVKFNKKTELPKYIENAIITSKNAWLAIKEKTTINQAFVVGSKTENIVEEANISIIEKANNAKELADQIIKKHAEKSFTFLCGNKRRDELPILLQQHQIQFNEIEVYQTKLNPKEFQQEFDGVLFFSPSAVKSFFKLNKSRNEIAFCIGNTTAQEAKKYTSTIRVANQPTIENVIVQVVKEFKINK
ncbi:uroporphyrinogen-III synthase [Mesonia aestuariivivens]|uniref:Uroporphyrinogen-III synthase n=1 Tax=Mesonia aestuariivivens TaxID=2796128 RepID=A0ABS6W1F6_9FLAO|nr:uroporphyrinogen-III synthase [Mesonia aestuariivivens]MBW2961665.1 uroporphyrinogen-III synthase [Mesonia aestuariivivens]